MNRHIRAQCDRFAERGYAVVAPALFGRPAPGIEPPYSEADLALGRQLCKDDRLGRPGARRGGGDRRGRRLWRGRRGRSTKS